GDDVVLRHEYAGAIVPGRANPQVADGVVAVAGIEDVGVAAVAADERIVAGAPVEDFAEIGADQRVIAAGSDQIHLVGVVLSVIDRSVGEDEFFYGVFLLTIAVVLVLERDAFARVLDGDDQIDRGAREHDIRAGEILEGELVVAAGVVDRLR